MENERELLSICTERLAQELPALRKICRLTQKNIGDLVGVSRQTITNIESGKCKMQWTLFLALILLFSLNRDCLNHIKKMEIPYGQVKEVLASKIKKGTQSGRGEKA